MHLSGRFAAVLGRLVRLVLLTLQFCRKGETKTSGQSWVRNELPCPGNRLKTQRIDSLEVLPEGGMSFMWVFSIVSEELGPALTLLTLSSSRSTFGQWHKLATLHCAAVS